MDWVILVSVWLGAAAIYFSGPAYLREKGKNAATREDIGTVTRIVEEIRLETRKDLEHLKSSLGGMSEAITRRRNVYEDLSAAWSPEFVPPFLADELSDL